MVRLSMLLMVFLAGGCRKDASRVYTPSGVRMIGIPRQGDRLPGPRSIAAAHDGGWLVLDEVGRVLAYDRGGSLQRSWMMPDTRPGRPEGIAQLQDGRIAVSDTHLHRVVIFEPDGTVSHQFGREGREPGEFIYPVAILQAPNGDLYVAEYGSNDRVQRFSLDGGYKGSFGHFGTEEHALQRPSGLAWRDGVIYVADAINHRIQKFSESGAWLGRVDDPGLVFPYDISWDNQDRLWVAEYGAGRITVLDADGRLLGRWGSTGRGPGQMQTPWGLDAGQDRTWIADTGNRRVVELVW